MAYGKWSQIKIITTPLSYASWENREVSIDPFSSCTLKEPFNSEIDNSSDEQPSVGGNIGSISNDDF